MVRFTLRGLWSRKLRTALTFVVVMLGVSLMAGTLVLTDTIRQTFDDLFADVNRGTDVYVRGVTQFETSFGDTQRPRLDESVVEDIDGVDGVDIAEPGMIDAVSVVADRGVGQRQLADRVQAELGDGAEVLTGAEITEENQDDIEEGLQFFTGFLTAFAVIALVVGAFVIYNSFTILVAQRNREMALLRAVGASRGQVLRGVLLEAVIIGSLASVAGFVLGLAVTGGLRAVMDAFGFDLPAGGIIVGPGGGV